MPPKIGFSLISIDCQILFFCLWRLGWKQIFGGLYNIHFHNWGVRILKYKQKIYWYTYPQKFPYCREWLFHGKFKCWVFIMFCQEKRSKAKFKLIFLKSHLVHIDFHFPGQGWEKNWDHKYLNTIAIKTKLCIIHHVTLYISFSELCTNICGEQAATHGTAQRWEKN